MRTHAWLASIVAGVLVLSACGGQDGPTRSEGKGDFASSESGHREVNEACAEDADCLSGDSKPIASVSQPSEAGSPSAQREAAERATPKARSSPQATRVNKAAKASMA